VVVNNSICRPDGREVYKVSELISAARLLNTKALTFCPISPVIRAEIEAGAATEPNAIRLSETDWTPTFDLDLYFQEPKPTIRPPFRIGRHGRDGTEKWHEDAGLLRQVYPDGADFSVSILGGAKKVLKTLGKLPDNWIVHEFGSIEPHEYLSRLDVFVYFPNSALVEAFGRTIVEAMLAGVPVILPQRFAATFGELPLYCEPGQVADLVRRLALDDMDRIAYLTELQQIVADRYSSRVIAQRLLAHVGLPNLDSMVNSKTELTLASKMYRLEIMKTVGI
jgi:hypothetical protein